MITEKCSPLYMAGTAQKIKFSVNNYFIKYDQIRRKLQIWSHLLKQSLMENFAFYAVQQPDPNREFLASKRKLLYDICTINLLSTFFPAQVRQTAIFLVLHGISSKVKPNSSSRFNLESRSVILANITTEIFQNQYKVSLKNSKLVNGNGEVICSIEINSL